ncbi:MAG: biotin/lipoyl-binding protein [Planctomycetes bacterium]|nr:biotin/lipoyl-binding protein [Planctomycetota bacterium]
MNTYDIVLNDKSYSVQIKDLSDDTAKVEVNGKAYTVNINGIKKEKAAVSHTPKHSSANAGSAPAAAAPAAAAPSGGGGSGSLNAPIPGSIMEIFVKEGDEVKAGQPVLKMEAMKMENEIKASSAGKIARIAVQVGDSVSQGQELLVIG